MEKLKLIASIILLCIFSCSSEDDNVENKEPNIICGVPTNITVNNITSTSASIHWQNDSNQIGVVFEYGFSGFQLGTGTRVNLSNSPFVLSQLLPSTQYDIYLKTRCNENLESGFSQAQSFITSCENIIFTGNLILGSQEEIDDFGSTCYTEIEGSLTLGGNSSNITSLASLNKISRIKDNLTISGTHLLNLIGLENLESIDEGGFRVNSNSSLTTLEGLSGLTHIETDITINYNVNLLSLYGLHDLFQVQNEFYEIYIRDNHSLLSINMENITHINTFFLYNNSSLTTLISLEDLIMNFEMDIKYNALLDNYCSLQNLFANGVFQENFTHIQGNLFNPSIQNIIDGLCSQ